MEPAAAQTPTDRELLLRMAKGHDASAQELWSRLGRPLAAYAAAMLRIPGSDGSHPVALDAVQSVFVRVLEADRHALARVGDVHAYLTAAVRNTVRNLVRSGERHEALRIRLARGASEPESPDARPLDQLQRALDRLPDDARELLLLKHVANLTLDQIALSLDENRNTIASRLRTAMDQIRELLTAAPPAAAAPPASTPRAVSASSKRSTEVHP